jgi:4-hydroxy-tetrahydrodipicolinate synthase
MLWGSSLEHFGNNNVSLSIVYAGGERESKLATLAPPGGTGMAEPLFRGVGVALATLFDDDGGLDAKATAGHAAALVDLGVRAVVVAGSTGEAVTLSSEERIALLTEVRRAVPATIPVLAGTGAPSRRQAVALTRAAVDHGADAVLVLSPPGSSDLRGYYGAVAEAAGSTPVLAYHYPKSSQPGIPVELLPELPIQGTKDSSGEPERLLAELDGFGGWLYVGASSILTMAGALGCTGAILAVANVEPERAKAAFAGNASAQRALFAGHAAARRDFPHGLKRLMAERFGTSTSARLG